MELKFQLEDGSWMVATRFSSWLVWSFSHFFLAGDLLAVTGALLPSFLLNWLQSHVTVSRKFKVLAAGNGLACFLN